MHPDPDKTDAAGDEAARLLQEGLDAIEPAPAERDALWRRIQQRTGIGPQEAPAAPAPAVPATTPGSTPGPTPSGQLPAPNSTPDPTAN